ncbi:hypothetical protein [Massilia sp.]|uniref:hypothetical protein n=1 Tax=Massilia sp. TaxID=1882437 RepID=UPI00352C4381
MSAAEQRRRGRGDLRMIDSAGLRLTDEERQIIANFRAMERCAQQMIVDVAAQYSFTLPAERVHLTLVG